MSNSNQEKRFLSRALRSSRYTAGPNAYCICVGGPKHFTPKDLEWTLQDVEEYFACQFSEFASHFMINLYGLLVHYHYTKITVRPTIGTPLSVLYDSSYVYWFRGELKDMPRTYVCAVDIQL